MKKLLVIRITINLITGGGMNNENCYGQANKYSNNEVNQITKKITSWNNCGDLWIFLVDKKNKGNKKRPFRKRKDNVFGRAGSPFADYGHGNEKNGI